MYPNLPFFFSITIGTFCPTMSYQPLAMSTTDDLDVESASNNHHSKATRKYWFKHSVIEVAVFVICCGISFVVGRQQNESTTRNQVPSSCKDQFFPSTDQFADTLIKVRFVGNQAGQRLVQWNMSFSNPSAHRGEPGPTVDAVWEDAEKCEQFYYCLLSQASPSAVGLRADTNTILITSWFFYSQHHQRIGRRPAQSRYKPARDPASQRREQPGRWRLHGVTGSRLSHALSEFSTQSQLCRLRILQKRSSLRGPSVRGGLSH